MNDLNRSGNLCIYCSDEMDKFFGWAITRISVAQENIEFEESPSNESLSFHITSI
ncbi:hypothetical protein [Phascolarctobacterium faecium]|uniref:hypothetical protein n=1 Tax=Phascolarctobacterium faecium TaxID=33025 RepID=UPI0026668893|nr:hypothetical protein [Phascolarctobacterium faecium]